jgi:hypothetical protein
VALVAPPQRLMSKRLTLNLALAALLLALAVWIWRELGPPPTPPGLSSTPAEQIRRIVVERSNGQMMRLTRHWDQWHLEEPRALPASRFHVDNVLKLLEVRSEAQYPAASMDLNALGLSEPRLRLSLGNEVFVFGGVDPLSQRRYVLHADQVHLIIDSFSPLLLGPWWNFIDRSLLDVTEEIVALELGDGRLLVGEQAQGVLARWRSTAASIVKPMEPTDAQRGRPVEMRLASGEAIRWSVIEEGEPRLLRPDLGLAYFLERSSLEALLSTTPDAR